MEHPDRVGAPESTRYPERGARRTGAARPHRTQGTALAVPEYSGAGTPMTNADERANAGRPDPASLLAQLKESERARLRVYIGAAPGVGKTYQMLEDAHLLKRQGVDIIIGFIEPHGRAETEALVRDLEQVPLHVDRLSRRAAQGDGRRGHPRAQAADGAGRRARAHERAGLAPSEAVQDVLELLDGGISVITAVNIQHIESLNDVVTREQRRPGARDDPRLVSAASRRGRQRRCVGGDAAHQAAAGKDLRRREDRAGAEPTSSARATCRRCASSRSDSWP